MTRAEREKRQREVVVSRAKLILIIVCLIAIPVTFWINHHDVGSVSKRITKVESPCQRYGPHSDVCKEAFEKAVATITHPEACAVERKAGTLRAIRELAAKLGVSFTEPCAGARLAQERQRGNEREATSRARTARNDRGPGGPPSTSTSGTTGVSGDSGPPQSGSHHAPAPQHPGSQAPPAPSNPGVIGEPSRTDTVSAAPAPSSEEQAQPPRASAAFEAPGLIGNPGGAVGEVTCGATNAVNELAGVRVCGK
jgi:hypothetical protein